MEASFQFMQALHAFFALRANLIRYSVFEAFFALRANLIRYGFAFAHDKRSSYI
jgi:hypothetical protein